MSFSQKERKKERKRTFKNHYIEKTFSTFYVNETGLLYCANLEMKNWKR